MLLATGPGIVVAGSVIGSGELINVPVQAAKFGFVLFWAVIISCVIKFFLQVELGRHCLIHNRTTIQAFNTCPGPKLFGTSWVGICYMIGYTLSTVTLAGILGALAGLLQSVLPLLADNPETSKNIWAVISFVVVAGILWQGRYGVMEKLVALLVCGFSLSVVVALVLVVRSGLVTMGDVTEGLKFSLGSVDHNLAAFAVISLLGALGTTANEMFMYPYWILEKGYARNLGTSDSPGWLDRARGWVGIMRLDAASATVLATVITAAYFLVGCAILHDPTKLPSQAEAPSGVNVVEDISVIFTNEETFGRFGLVAFYIFMFGGFCTLFSTLIVAAAATGRMWTDLLSSFGWLDWNNAESRSKCNRFFQTFYLTAFLLIEVSGRIPAEKLVIVGQYINGLVNTPLIMFGICWLAFHTDRRLRMRTVTALLMVATVIVILLCLAAGLYVQGQGK